MRVANITLLTAVFMCLFSVTVTSAKELNGILSCKVIKQIVLGVNEGDSIFYPNLFEKEQIIELNYVYTDNKELVIEMGPLTYVGLSDELTKIVNDVAVFKAFTESISFGKKYIRTEEPTSELIFNKYLSKRNNRYFWDGYMMVDVGGDGVIKSLITLNCFDASELIDVVFEKIVSDRTT